MSEPHEPGSIPEEQIARDISALEVLSEEEIEALILWCDRELDDPEVAPILANAIVEEATGRHELDLYDVSGRVFPPIGGDQEVGPLTMAPNADAARNRFAVHFSQMGRMIVGVPKAGRAAERLLDMVGIGSIDELREEISADLDHLIADHAGPTDIPIEGVGEPDE